MILPSLDLSALRELASPDRLAVLAALHGLAAPRPERATLLELSRADIAGAQQDGERADFVVALDLLSRLEPAERPALWRLIAARLAPGGTALVSFDVMPGSLELQPLYGLMRYHVVNVADDARALGQARDMAHWHTDRIVTQFGAERGQALEHALAEVRALSDSELLDVLRAPERHPLLISDVAAEAAAAGLSWYGNARCSEPDGRMLPGPLRELAAGGDAVRRQQYLDFFLMTRQRTSLFCHAPAPRHEIRPEDFAPMWITSRVLPEAFDGAERARIASAVGEEALSRAATELLQLLARAAPAALAVAELDAVAGLTRDALLAAVAELWRGDVVSLSLGAPAP